MARKKKTILKRKWKTIECTDKYDCWCRGIVAIDAKPKKINGRYWGKDIFLPVACIGKVAAEYFVELHNKSLSE